MVQGSEPSSDVADILLRLKAAVHGAPTSDGTAVSQGEAADEDAWADARMRAAVTGSFDPLWLAETLPPDRRDRVLSRLLRDCEVVSRKGERLWQMQRGPRRTALAHLVGDPQRLAAVLTRRNPTEDLSGQILGRLLAGDEPSVPADQLNIVAQVADWVSGILVHAPDVTEVKRQIARKGRERRIDMLVGSGFAGRKRELDRLRAFIDGDGPWPRKARLERPPVFGLSGIGGVGKSTLLARLIQENIGNRPSHAPSLVVAIDFDDPRFGPDDLLNLTFEVTRRLGAEFPQIAGELSDLRHMARRNFLGGWRVGLESVARSSNDIHSQLRNLLSRHGLKSVRIVVILDTFEVFQSARDHGGTPYGERSVRAICNWLTSLVSEAGLTNLKAIIAGRSPLEEVDALRPLLVDEIRLGELSRWEGQRLLLNLGLAPPAARAMRLAFGGNPLALRLLAHLLRRVPGLKAEDLAGGKAPTADHELLQGILYQRILGHLRDPELRNLAHPGLVLRRVTPHLIREVLAPQCGLDVSGKRSRVLFERLAHEAWLVQRVDHDTVVHRRDLRRVMMRLIAKDAGKAAQARAIHAAAVEVYRAGGEKALTPAAAKAEELYHRLMIADPRDLPTIAREEIRLAQATLVQDVDDLPPASATWVGYCLGWPLSKEQGLSLPMAHRREWVLARGSQLMAEDDPEQALELCRQIGIGFRRDPPVWALEALEWTVRWDEVKDARSVKETLRDGPDRFNKHLPVCRMNYFRGDMDAIGHYLATMWSVSLRSKTFHPTPFDSQVAIAAAALELMARWDRLILKPLEVKSWVLAMAYNTNKVLAKMRGDKTVMSIDINRIIYLSRKVLRLCVFDNTDMHALSKLPIMLSQDSFIPSLSWLGVIRRLFLDLGKRDAAIKLTHVEGMVDQAIKSGQASSGFLLGTVSQAYGDIVKKLTLNPHPDLRMDISPLLVGPNPELRGPARFVLRQAFRTGKDCRQLAEIGCALFDIQPVDLRPKVFGPAAARDPKRSIATLVEYADRSQVLAPLLDEAARLRPEEKRLRRVADVARRWERILTPEFLQRSVRSRGGP